MRTITMLSLTLLMMLSCGKKRVCDNNGTEVPCEYYDLYTEHSAIEAEINASFDEDVITTFEEDLALREKWMAIYEASPDSLKEAYRLMGAERQYDLIVEMRVEEYEYFQERKKERAELQEFLKSLEIEAMDSDTSIWGTEKPSLIWKVKNNSEATIKGFVFFLNYYEDGKMVNQKKNYFVRFSAEQLTPRPEEGEESYLKPGGSAMMSFDKSGSAELQPEIYSVSFLEEES